jgi:hypothetical protein
MIITKPTARAKTVRTTGEQVVDSSAMPLELLDQIDQAAAAINISRAGFINHKIRIALDVTYESGFENASKTHR